MHSLPAESRPRLSVTEPKWFVFELSGPQKMKPMTELAGGELFQGPGRRQRKIRELCSCSNVPTQPLILPVITSTVSVPFCKELTVIFFQIAQFAERCRPQTRNHTTSV